ncbi:MAG: hypothetical protein MAG458_01134 [Nitrosopumilus sp.]|nr:hypothetical protein [Nitrosopumilus sp.]
MHKITSKLESQLPVKTQQFSEIYTAYLHAMNNTFDSCITCEKEFMDKLGVDKAVLQAFVKLSQSQTDSVLQQMDFYAQWRKYSNDMQLSAVKSWDNFMQVMSQSNLKMFNPSK